MPQKDPSAEKAIKTGKLLGLGNLFLLPIYFFSPRLGLAASLLLTSAAIYKLNELGKKRRPGSNVINNVNTFFSSLLNSPSAEMENTFKNIVNGGAALYDEFNPSRR